MYFLEKKPNKNTNSSNFKKSLSSSWILDDSNYNTSYEKRRDKNKHISFLVSKKEYRRMFKEYSVYECNMWVV